MGARETEMQKTNKNKAASNRQRDRKRAKWEHLSAWGVEEPKGRVREEVTSQEDRNQTLQGQMLKCEM